MNRRHNGNFKALIEKADQEKKLELLVQWTLSEFDLFYTRFNEITESAKSAFEKKDYWSHGGIFRILAGIMPAG